MEQKEQIPGKRKAPFIYGWLISIPIMFIVSGCFIVLGVIIYNSFNDYSQDFRNNLIAIYSAIAGGFCTLLGVVMTVHNDSFFKNKQQKEKYRPEFFIPIDSYNYFGFEKYYLLQVGVYEKTKKSPLVDMKLRFKNTDKTPFKIARVFCDDIVYEGREIFIEKNKKFCLILDLPNNETINKVVVSIISLDNRCYAFSIDDKEKTVSPIKDRKELKKYVDYRA